VYIIEQRAARPLKYVSWVTKQSVRELLRDGGRMARHAADLRETANRLLVRASDMDRRSQLLVHRAAQRIEPERKK
jgi:hypothetical protein